MKEISKIRGKYKYHIVYRFKAGDSTGGGRTFLLMEGEIQTQEDIEKIEDHIKDENKYEKVFVESWNRISTQ